MIAIFGIHGRFWEDALTDGGFFDLFGRGLFCVNTFDGNRVRISIGSSVLSYLLRLDGDLFGFFSFGLFSVSLFGFSLFSFLTGSSTAGSSDVATTVSG